MIGVIVAFVYGYGGMFAAGNMTLANIYPITASLGLIGYRSYDTSVQWSFPLCLCSLIIIVAISVILVATMKEKENKNKKSQTKERVVISEKKLFLYSNVLLVIVWVFKRGGVGKI